MDAEIVDVWAREDDGLELEEDVRWLVWWA